MRAVLPLLAGGLILAPASSAEEAGASRPRVALAASPARIAVAAPGSRAVELRNVGVEGVVVDVARRALGRGAPPSTWLTIVPARLSLRPGARAVLTVRVRAPRRARPGDHHALLLLTTRPLRGAQVGVRIRLGLSVRMRAPGPIARRLEVRGIRVRRPPGARVLFFSLVNSGNVTEELGGRVTVSLVRRGRVVARLRPQAPRELLPGGRAGFAPRYRGPVRGLVTAVVQARAGSGLRLERRFRIRL